MKRLRFLLESAFISILLGAGVLGQAAPVYHAESQPVAGGAELVTVFADVSNPPPGPQNLEIPLIAVLRDSLGDDNPANDRLRSVWILTSARPTPWQRFASAISFGYFRAGNRRHADGPPSPALDIASPLHSLYANLIGNSIQVLEFDPLGAAIRSTTRTYRDNFSDYNQLQTFEALANLDNAAQQSHGLPGLPQDQLREIYARLSLSTREFGGLVRQQNLIKFYGKESSQQQEMRGHNWELLRQRAELNGLYFEPLSIGAASPSQALLWVARSDLKNPAKRHFNGQFLGIANPWNDTRLQQWTGYSQIRYFDSENRPVSPNTPGAHAIDMIPLALYSLDYPKAPLLLVDFRRSLAPKAREIVDKGADGVVTGVLGFTHFTNPSFFAADWLWLFVRGRHGAAVNRTARLEAYSEAREFLSFDAAMAPALKNQLRIRLNHLALNPRENDIAHEATLAREHYADLVAYLNSPRAVAKLERDRARELQSYTQSPGDRVAASLARIFTRGPHVKPSDYAALRARLDVYRRAHAHEQFLKEILASGPRPDVVWDANEIRQSVDALSEDAYATPQAQKLIQEVYARSGDPELRSACARALESMNRRTSTAREASLAPWRTPAP